MTQFLLLLFGLPPEKEVVIRMWLVGNFCIFVFLYMPLLYRFFVFRLQDSKFGKYVELVLIFSIVVPVQGIALGLGLYSSNTLDDELFDERLLFYALLGSLFLVATVLYIIQKKLHIMIFGTYRIKKEKQNDK